MRDRDPLKLLMCVKDVYTGIILPWHLGRDHRDAVDKICMQIDAAIRGEVDDDSLKTIVDDAIITAQQIAETSRQLHHIHEKMDRARLVLECICDRFKTCL